MSEFLFDIFPENAGFRWNFQLAGSTLGTTVLKLPRTMSTEQGRRMASRFSTQDTMPDDLRVQALVRLKSLLRVLLVIHVIAMGLNGIGPQSFGWAPGCSALGALEHGLGVFLTVAFLVALNRSQNSNRMLNYGLAYQVVTCFVAAFSEQAQPHNGISVVAVLILIFPLFVPREASKTLLVGLLSAATAPLAFWLYDKAGPSGGEALVVTASQYAQFGTNFLFALLAVVPSKVMANLTREVRSARRMGSYELVEKLGAGGMGEVWRGLHSLLRRPAAIKLVRQEVLEGAQRDKVLQRFEREAQATAALESPHTVELFDFGVAQDGSLFYVMELLNGINLEKFVETFGPMRPERVAWVLEQACDSLDDAHEHGLIHRDIKPANLMICKKGRRRDFVKVVDFGLVRPTFEFEGDVNISKTAEGQIRGTPAYLSPEAVTGDGVIDARSDLYALGCVAYYLLTGKLVFDAESPVQMAIAHAVKEPMPVREAAEQEVPQWFSDLIMRMLSKEPEQRPASAMEVLKHLRQAQWDSPWSQERAEQFWSEHLSEIERRPRMDCSKPHRGKRCCEIRMGTMATQLGDA